ncbi:MAG: hypothetical protein SFW64_06895 [Alphaproteobacteria bacterium]|nr:hypothetical protein [Alphaproteobacteria bacterium]
MGHNPEFPHSGSNDPEFLALSEKVNGHLEEIYSKVRAGITPGEETVVATTRANSHRRQRDSEVKRTKPKSRWLESVATENKVNAGIWGAVAALSMFGVYSAAKNSVVPDESGKPQVQWSQVGVALLEACMVAGCTYMGVQALRAGSAVR